MQSVLDSIHVVVLTEKDGDQDLKLYWIVARPEYADRIYLHYERQESEQRPSKRAFGRANSALVFQEAQAIDMFSVPMIHLFYSDKSYSGQHRGHYPGYGTSEQNNMQLNVEYAMIHTICILCEI